MHNDVPKDDRPLFAQGAIYTTPPPTPLRYGRGYSPQAMYSPGFSPNFQQDYHRSPDCSPRFSTPNHYYNQRAPKLAREDRRGSPRSSWHANDSCVSGSSRFSSLSVHSPHSQKRFSGSQGSPASRSWQSSPSGSGGIHRYLKESMVQDPWAELEQQLKRTDTIKRGGGQNVPASQQGDQDRVAFEESKAGSVTASEGQ